ncbi:MAG: GTPase ObgE, partial [Oscillospiraceae bacterium]|nr:GTPase ObgE [Oscillospiraceae bacterium]
MFIDTAKISIKAGDGGNGAVTFHREKYVANGGSDGGDGGKGGNVVFVADTNQNTLSDYRYTRKHQAENGENGRGSNCFGKGGKDLYLKVPHGTLVRDASNNRLLADISGAEPVIIAKGGKGGWGNAHFANSVRQAPRFAKLGAEGERFEVLLELKLLADVGLIGFPNVGKSTLLSVVSEAKPKIADYHFTTLSPVLGVVRVGDTSFVMADIPGLIAGASSGVGLGLDFLRHVERCRLFVHVVDVSGSEGRDPITDFEAINAELAAFSPELATRPQLVAGNKCDIADDGQITAFETYITGKGHRFFRVTAVANAGVPELVSATAQILQKLPPIPAFKPDPVPEESVFAGRYQPFTVRREND